MRESERKRLVRLVDDFCREEFGVKLNKNIREKFADHLLDDGWTRPPVKAGQTVYCIIKGINEPLKSFVHKVELYDLCSKITVWVKGYLSQEYADTSVGKTVFLTREEAEAKLKGGEDK